MLTPPIRSDSPVLAVCAAVNDWPSRANPRRFAPDFLCLVLRPLLLINIPLSSGGISPKGDIPTQVPIGWFRWTTKSGA